ncbi:MAG: hypothetical protein RL217_1002 [Pseudomonadota bacterium]|jgi:anaerobic ribonucleoside-triphosphate reductase activating protein
MYYSSEQIVWQEVPGEVSLAYGISGCPLRCVGCHSADTWPLMSGKPLNEAHFLAKLDQYQGLITCVLFLGGEWHEAELITLLACARARQLKTCLYTGFEEVSPALKAQLTFIKLGPWHKDLGGLDSPNTNQRFIEVETGQVLNNLFQNKS